MFFEAEFWQSTLYLMVKIKIP